MDTNSTLLDHPEVADYFKNVFPIIITESDRGAILIAASQVDLFLKQALRKIAPQKISQKKLKILFDFTGPMGTFSSRINMAYFMRIINNEVRCGITSLKDLRNEAAHYPTNFSLSSKHDKINNLYELGPGIPESLQVWATEAAINNIIINALSDCKNTFSDASEVINYIKDNQDIQSVLLLKIQKWKLGLSIALLCGLIFHGSHIISNLFENNRNINTPC